MTDPIETFYTMLHKWKEFFFNLQDKRFWNV